MKILLLSHVYPAFQGQSVQQTSYALHNFVKYWVLNHEVLVLRLVKWPRRKKTIEKLGMHQIDGVPVHCVPAFQIPRTKAVLIEVSARRMLHSIKFRPDIVVSHATRALFMGHRISKLLGCPHICGLHSVDIEFLNKGYLFKHYQKALSECSAIACRSPSIQRSLLGFDQRWHKKSFLANSGVESEAIIDRDLILKKFNKGKESRTIQIITTAKLRKLKNVDIVLRALASLGNRVDWDYSIIGDGEEKSNLIELADRLGISDRVHFTGLLRREEVLHRLRSSHLFVMVSAPETFGLAYLEAMANGNVVIGSKGHGIDGIVENGSNGFLCSPRNEKELVDTFIYITDSENVESLKEIALRSWCTAKEMSEERVSADYLNKILETLSSVRI